VHDRVIAIGINDRGRSDTRAAPRQFYELDRRAIALSARSAIDPLLTREFGQDHCIEHSASPPLAR
jgi:pyruvate dehydrogenase complex dehydrogenase (E1) component